MMLKTYDTVKAAKTKGVIGHDLCWRYSEAFVLKAHGTSQNVEICHVEKG